MIYIYKHDSNYIEYCSLHGFSNVYFIIQTLTIPTEPLFGSLPVFQTSFGGTFLGWREYGVWTPLMTLDTFSRSWMTYAL